MRLAKRRPALRRLAAAAVGMLLALSARVRAADRLPEGVTPDVDRRIQEGTSYLVRTQNRDGSWNNMGGWGTYPTAMTALAGTALLMTGNTPTQGSNSRAVRKATEFLLRVAQPNGLIATPAEEGRSLHGHGFALLFLGQVYGMEEDRTIQRRIHDVLARGVRITERSQSRAGGWLYSPNSDGDEGSVTVTQIQGLRSCRDSGIQVNAATVKNAVRYIERSANPDGGIRYNISGGESRPPITAAAVATLYNAGSYDSPLALKCLTYCDRSISVNSGGNLSWGHFFYSHLYYAQAKYQRGGKEWERYYKAICTRLAGMQATDGSWMGDDVGTSYGTAIAIVILALPYQNVPIYQR
ncbi:MAG TPA: prenyltransferase/squalene oxidase repeat-containing protein [Planctomycetota bacterium]|nr:prenyltransferase/squalene oxidase repeat-containing protein [Planctomycetota bacterium]